MLPVDVWSLTQSGQNELRPHIRKPTKLELEQLIAISDVYTDRAADMTGYLYDVSIEAQNLLLGKLFGNQLPRRQPLDKKVLVLDSSPSILAALERTFAQKQQKKLTEIFSEYDLERQELLQNIENG